MKYLFDLGKTYNIVAQKNLNFKKPTNKFKKIVVTKSRNSTLLDAVVCCT